MLKSRVTHLKPFWLYPWFIAIPVALLVIWLLPDMFGKYSSEIIFSSPVDKPGGYEYYADLNGDGYSERIVLFNNTKGKASVKILDLKDFILDHFYFSGVIIQNPGSLITGVFDSSGRVGIFLMTRSNDSILLHGVVPSGKRELFRDMLITTLAEENGQKDFSATSAYLIDLDRDGTREFVSGILAGFQAHPRFSFSYNFRTGMLKITPTTVNHNFITDTVDLNRDGFPELITDSYAIDNNEGRIQTLYDDNSAWMMVFDHNLEFFFPPVQYRGKYVRLALATTSRYGKDYIFAVYEPRIKGTGFPKLMLFDAAGRFIRDRILDDTSCRTSYSLFRSDELSGRIFLLREGGILEEYDTNLSVVDRKVIDGVESASIFQTDIDGDGSRESIFTASEGAELMITDAGFSNPVRIYIPAEPFARHFQTIREQGVPGRLYMQSGNQRFIFSYEHNPWFYLKYPVYLAIYVVILLFFSLIHSLQRKRLRQLINAEKQITKMQLMLLNNQLDPHFTFNAINSISASLLEEKPEEANQRLLALSRLMRLSVQQADKLSRSLAEELEFLQSYLSLIRHRLNGQFTYRFDISDEVDLQLHIPKMIIQIFAENAVKHGLRPLKEGGNLDIIIRQSGKEVQIEINDNGVGRKVSRESGPHGTGKGMKIIDQTILIINKYNQRNITYSVSDLSDGSGKPAGTSVRITIPDGMNYSFF